MPNYRTDICAYDYKYPGKCYHCDDCTECKLFIAASSLQDIDHHCKCLSQSLSNVINDINYNCPYFEPLNKEKHNEP